MVTHDLPRSAAHPFYTRLNQILDAHDFDGDVEGQCQRFYADDGSGTPQLDEEPVARDAVCRNRRRIRGPRGLLLLRLRGSAWNVRAPIVMSSIARLEHSKRPGADSSSPLFKINNKSV